MAASNIPSPVLGRLQRTERIVKKIINYPELSTHSDFTKYLIKILTRHPIWDVEPTKYTMTEVWKKRRRASGGRNALLVDNPESRVFGFELPGALWTTSMHTRRISKSILCGCDMQHTLRHIVDTRLQTRL